MTELGRCDIKQYEHVGLHEQIMEHGQRLPPFPCENWKPDTPPAETGRRSPDRTTAVDVAGEIEFIKSIDADAPAETKAAPPLGICLSSASNGFGHSGGVLHPQRESCISWLVPPDPDNGGPLRSAEPAQTPPAPRRFVVSMTEPGYYCTTFTLDEIHGTPPVEPQLHEKLATNDLLAMVTNGNDVLIKAAGSAQTPPQEEV